MNKKDYIKEFISKLSNLDRSRSISTVFNDFLTLSYCSLAQTVYRKNKSEFDNAMEQFNKFNELVKIGLKSKIF